MAKIGEEYKGLTVAQAKEVAQRQNRTLRIVKEDGADRMCIQDYRPGRINVEVEDGVVVAVSVEGL